MGMGGGMGGMDGMGRGVPAPQMPGHQGIGMKRTLDDANYTMQWQDMNEAQRRKKLRRQAMPRSAGGKGGMSCHQCKRRFNYSDLIYCTTSKHASKTGRKCRKKYCPGCLKTIYDGRYEESILNNDFVCPACLGECTCAACRRKQTNDRLKSDGIRPDSVIGKIPKRVPIIEFMQPGGQDVQKKQATNLLTVLATKPEARKIIRAAMEVQFCNPHSKILYVAHIIRQVLRLDIDAEYAKQQQMVNEQQFPDMTGVPPPVGGDFGGGMPHVHTHGHVHMPPAAGYSAAGGMSGFGHMSNIPPPQTGRLS